MYPLQIKEFLNNVCEQIKYKPIRNEISEELQSHIEEAKENYINFGLEEKEAEKRAIEQMGEAEEIGKKLNKIHKPRFNLQLFILVLILLEFGFLASRVSNLDNWKMNLITISLTITPFVLIYFFDYTKLKKYANIIYAIPTIMLIYSSINQIRNDTL